MRNPFRRDEPVEERAITSVPWNVGGSITNALSIDQTTALSLAPVYAANRLLATSVSTLPLKAYRRIDDERVPMRSLPQLFDRLVTSGEIVPWLHRCVTSLGLQGNAYGLITQRDGFGFPIDITWLNPTRISVDTPYGVAVWRIDGKVVDRDSIFHIPWFSLPGETLGLSPISAFAVTMNMGLSASQYGLDWFSAGGIPPGTFRNTEKTVKQEDAALIKRRLVNAIRTREPIVYGSDWEYQPISVKPADAQLVESARMTANQVAAIYGVPPEMIGGETGKSMTYQNVEQQSLNFVTFTLRPWLVALESAFSAILPERQYVRFNSDALVRADTRTRHDIYKIDREIGLRNLDEIRALEDLPPLPDGQGQEYAPAVPDVPEPPPDRTELLIAPPPTRSEVLNINVSPPDVHVTVEPADVRVEPALVTVNQPDVIMPAPGKHALVRTVERDTEGRISRIVDEETT